jgi:hypothetical protein
MITISYPLAENEEPNEELEDQIDHLMGDADYGMCGSGGWSREVRDLEFEGDTGEQDREFNELTFLHQQLKDLHPGITWTIDADPEDD